MKTIALFLLSLLLVAMVHGQDAPLPPAPPEILAARARYQAALDASAVPVRTRYVEDLRAMMARAVQAKNLALVAALEAEMKSLVSPTDKGGSFSKRISGTTWTWENPTSRITFQAGGEALYNGQKAGFTWKITDKNSRVVEGTFAGGRVFKFVFDDKLQTAKGSLDGFKLFDSKLVP